MSAAPKLEPQAPRTASVAKRHLELVPPPPHPSRTRPTGFATHAGSRSCSPSQRSRCSGSGRLRCSEQPTPRGGRSCSEACSPGSSRSESSSCARHGDGRPRHGERGAVIAPAVEAGGPVADPAGGETVIAGICGVCAAGCGVDVVLEQGRIKRLRPRQGHPRGHRLHARDAGPGDRLLAGSAPLPAAARRRARRGPLRARLVGRCVRLPGRAAAGDRGRARARGARRLHGPRQLRARPRRGVRPGRAGRVLRERRAVPVRLAEHHGRRLALLRLLRDDRAVRACFGQEYRDLTEDLDHADLALVWGANPATASPPENLVRLKQVQARGGRVVVIDPRRSETARALRAEWVGIRPGTDGALALGLLHVLIAERLLRPRLRGALHARLRRAGRLRRGVRARARRDDHRCPGRHRARARPRRRDGSRLLDPHVHGPRVLELGRPGDPRRPHPAGDRRPSRLARRQADRLPGPAPPAPARDARPDRGAAGDRCRRVPGLPRAAPGGARSAPAAGDPRGRAVPGARADRQRLARS